MREEWAPEGARGLREGAREGPLGSARSARARGGLEGARRMRRGRKGWERSGRA